MGGSIDGVALLMCQMLTLYRLVNLTICLWCSSGFSAEAQNADPIVVMQTTKGPIEMQIYLGAVPYTSRNFLDLVQRGFYTNLTFHRVERWCIQGGDPLGNGRGNFIDPDTGQPRFIRREINPRFKHMRPGVIAMARSNHPDSASCQFYITKQPVPFLDGQYAIFGGVLRGMEAVNRMTPGDRIISAEIVQPGVTNTTVNGTPPSTERQLPAGESGF